ncbi:S8 family serine peptidase [Salinarimonas sp.]|uniref:S8 family peptidase n=1 Tax=Salinarimonas sp. TaxID=2766526 RepID=UPI0032D99457
MSFAGVATMAPPFESVGADAFVIRGVIDEADLDRVVKRVQDATGQNRVFADAGVDTTLTTCIHTPPVGTHDDVRRELGAAELERREMTGRGVAVAIVDTGFNVAYLRQRGHAPHFDAAGSWSAEPTVSPGQARVGHGTMCAHSVLLAAPEALLIDFPVLLHQPATTPLIKGILSDVIIAYNKLLQMMETQADARGFHSLVISNSWGMYHPTWDFPPGNPGRYFDNPMHPFNRLVSSLASAGADIVFAAGNCGPACPDRRCQPIPGDVADRRISGANSHPEVLCVGGVDLRGAAVGYSTRGPGALQYDKPDLAAYTHFLGSEALGAGRPDLGTSTACPVASGVVAALRSSFPYQSSNPRRTPARIAQYLRDTASNPLPSRWNADFGYGIVDTSQFDSAGNVL